MGIEVVEGDLIEAFWDAPATRSPFRVKWFFVLITYFNSYPMIG